MLRKWGALVLLLLAAPALAFAQNNGKLAGRILDASSGEALPGATIVLEGTTFGTATDIDGNYFIIGIPVGAYDVQASFVGYQSERVEGVQISTGYTREIDFDLSPGVELDEIVVTYERPLIQKDAIGVPKIVNAEEIVNLPVRGAADVAKIQAGVVSQEGSTTLNIRGGRGAEVTYYVDGVKVQSGVLGMPQSAIQEQEMLIGNINARYGDVMSGVINITTKSGAPNFFGSLEGVTSQSLDDYGYNLVSGTLGGPIVPNKLSFFLAGEFNKDDDTNPRALGELYVPDGILNDLRANPIAFTGLDANGSNVFFPIPAGLADGATLNVDDAGVPVADGGVLTFSDGTTVSIGNADPSTIDLRPILRAEQVSPDQFEIRNDKRDQAFQNLALSGNLTWNIFENGRLRVGGRLNQGEWDRVDNLANRRVVFAPEMARKTERDDYQIYGTWTQYLSNSTFYQVQVDYSSYRRELFDPRFGKGFDDFLRYGDFEEAAFSTMRGYKDLTLVPETRINDNGTPEDPSDDTEFTVNVPTYNYTYEDGSGPPTGDDVVSSLVQVPGGRFNDYQLDDNTQFRLTASATTQIGINQVEFGAEYEQQTNRQWFLNAGALARFVNDANGPEQIAADDPDLDPNGYSSYDAIPTSVLEDYVTYYGFDVRGKEKVNDEDLLSFINQDQTKPDVDYNIAPYEPIYYGGYVQDKIEFRDMVLNLGLRLDVFDNNTLVFKDRFARRPIVRAGELGGAPAGIGNDFAVYFSGDDVVGYRDTDGAFYDLNGQVTEPGDILLNGQPRQTNGQVTEDMFEDYKPEVTLMPRIGVSFPVTDQALFFASYGVVSQRPSSNTFVRLDQFQGSGGVNNTNLRPEKTTKYELGFRQRLGSRSALTISGFFHQIENLIQQRALTGASPSTYNTFENVDFGTVKGVEFGFDMRRTNGVSTNVNYTLSFADGTGSANNSTGVIVWVNETPPNFISALNFDQRHRINASLDYRLGAGEGPTVFGAKLLENFGINVLATAGSGFPYTAVVDPENIGGAARAEVPLGGINTSRMSWQSRVDLRFDRRFLLSGGASVTAFLWVQNLFDSQNVNNVWRYTGLPDDDGFLATAEGRQFLGDKPITAGTLYDHRNRLLGNVGIPRLTRLGVRFDF